MSFVKKLKKILYSYKIKGNKLKIKIVGIPFYIPTYKATVQPVSIPSSAYGKIFLPYYNQHSFIQNEKPEIYNKDGKKMDVYFIRDDKDSHAPYYKGNGSKYFLWDRFNIGLDTHFYSHNSMLEVMGKPLKRYGILSETPGVVPDDYLIFEKNRTLSQDFDLIFTYDERILNKVPNARFFPYLATPWYGNEINCGYISADAYQYKTKNISIVSSNKKMCELHKIRIEIAEKCKKKGLSDTFGTFDGGRMINISESLEKYRYSIIVENDLSPFLFTEKITNCFVAQTVPIYLGTSKIGKFFNTDGIIQLNMDNISNIENILLNCNEKDYLQRLPAIKENYERVKKYTNKFDWLYEEYLNK